MAYSPEKREEALALMSEEIEGKRPSLRVVARQLGVSPNTVRAWSAEAGLATEHLDATDISSDTAKTAQATLRKAKKLLAGIETIDADSQMKRATAIEKLVNSHLKLLGAAPPSDNGSTNTQVNILLQDLLRG